MDNNHSNYSCNAISVMYPDFVDYLSYRILFGLLYSSLFLLGLSGNLLVIYCITWRHISVGVNSIQILSLAHSDLLLCLTSLPFSGFHNFNRVWPLGSFWCKAMPTLQAASTFICVFTLAAIAIDRYRKMSSTTIVTRRQSVRSKLDYFQYMIVVMIWSVGFLAAVPYTLNMQLTHYPTICGMFCEEAWYSHTHAKIYGTFVFVVEFVCPLIILLYCYGGMRMMVQSSFQRTHRTSQSVGPPGRNSREHKTSRIIVLMCLAFAFSWMPINLLNISRDFHMIGVDYLGIIFAAAHLAAMSSVIWNPLIYCWMNSNFQKQFVALVWCKESQSAPVDDNEEITDVNQSLLLKKPTKSCLKSNIMSDARTNDPRIVPLYGKDKIVDEEENGEIEADDQFDDLT